MWSAVPDLDDLSSGSESDEVKSGNSGNEFGDRERSPPDASNAQFVDNKETAPPRGVAQQHWQSFCNLKRRREGSSQSNSHRIKKQRPKYKTDQKDVSISETPSSSTDIQKYADGSKLTNDDKVMLLNPYGDTKSQDEKTAESGAQSKEHQEHWDTLKKYLNVNEHVQQGIDHGQYNPNKCGLEKQLDQAVEEGKFEEAEELSDQLAKRDLACKIAKSADARDYLAWKKEEQTKKKAKRKKKKLNWGFEAKERWQMKGNM